jgi:hypothetical protein
MKRWIWISLTLPALACTVVACGDDDNGGGPGKTDGGTDGQTPGNDGGPPGDGGRDGGPNQCTFAGYVINLINTQTTPSAVPTTDLGDQCTPSTSQADFQTLFP